MLFFIYVSIMYLPFIWWIKLCVRGLRRQVFLHAPQCPWPARKRFRRDHFCRGRVKPVAELCGRPPGEHRPPEPTSRIASLFSVNNRWRQWSMKSYEMISTGNETATCLLRATLSWTRQKLKKKQFHPYTSRCWNSRRRPTVKYWHKT